MEDVIACSVIIPTRNRPGLVVDTVRRILEGTRVPAECIVVDQSDSPNPELAAIRDPRCDVRVVRSSIRGTSIARNIGARQAKYDVLVFADDDVLAEHGWLETLTGALAREGDDAVVSGNVVAGPPEVAGAFVPSLTSDIEYMSFSGRIARDPLCGGNCAMRRDLFEDLGEFDERIRIAEDNDFGYRLLASGRRIVTVPEAVMVHRAWRAKGKSTRGISWRYGIWQGSFYVKHMSLRDPWMLARMLAELNAKNPLRKGRDVIYSLGLISGAVSWAMRERLVPRLRGTPAPLTVWSGPSGEPFRYRSWVASRRTRRRAERAAARAARGKL